MVTISTPVLAEPNLGSTVLSRGYLDWMIEGIITVRQELSLSDGYADVCRQREDCVSKEISLPDAQICLVLGSSPDEHFLYKT